MSWTSFTITAVILRVLSLCATKRFALSFLEGSSLRLPPLAIHAKFARA